MTFAMAHGVAEAGVAFAAMMIIGVGAVLSAVAMATVLARAGFGAAIKRFGRGLALMSRTLLALTGALLIALAVQQIFPNFSWSFRAG
jgi:ABC-type nickel/cobalt efflux system permease component RcnA